MNRLVYSILAILSFTTLHAQTPPPTVTEDSEASVDTRPQPVHRMDSSYLGKSIFEVMPAIEKGDRASVTVNQSQAVTDSLVARKARNSFNGKIRGYRIRIYFSNARNAREASAAVAGTFQSSNPEHAVYRSYNNPYFKVTVGNFRTKSEALLLKHKIASQFPSAFIVREEIVFDY